MQRTMKAGLAIGTAGVLAIGLAAFRGGSADSRTVTQKPAGAADAKKPVKTPAEEAGAFLFINTGRIAGAVASDPKQGARIMQELIGSKAEHTFKGIAAMLDGNPPLGGEKSPVRAARPNWKTRLPHVLQRAFCFHEDIVVALQRFEKPVPPNRLETLVHQQAVKKTGAGFTYFAFRRPKCYLAATRDGHILIASTNEDLLRKYAQHAAVHGEQTLEPKSLAAARGAAEGAEMFFAATAPYSKPMLHHFGVDNPVREKYERISAELGGKPYRPRRNPWEIIFNGTKQIVVQIDRKSDVPARIAFTVKSEESAKQVRTLAGKGLDHVREQLRVAAERKPNPKSRYSIAAWEKSLIDLVQAGLHIQRTGTVVVVELRHKGGLPRLLEGAVREIFRTGEAASNSFNDVSNQLK